MVLPERHEPWDSRQPGNSETNLRVLKKVNKTLILEESKRHKINDDICSKVEMSKTPAEYMKGSKGKKYKKTKKKSKKKSKK